MTCENVEGHMDEDMGFDRYLEEMYEDRYPEPYEEPDYEVFERNQLTLDNDAEVWDDEDDDGEYWYDSDEYDDGPLY